MFYLSILTVAVLGKNRATVQYPPALLAEGQFCIDASSDTGLSMEHFDRFSRFVQPARPGQHRGQ